MVLGGALFLAAIAWAAYPVLQAGQAAADAAASRELEVARRLLHGFSPGLSYNALLVDQLRESDVTLDDPDAVLESATDDYQEQYTTTWESFSPVNWLADPPRPDRPSVGNLARQIRDGLTDRTQLIGENSKRLGEALAAVDRALSIKVGDASSQSHAEAARLKGGILYHMGLAQRIAADLRRNEAGAYRRRLILLGAESAELQPVAALVSATAIDQQIQTLEGGADKGTAALTASRKSLQSLDATIADLQARLDNAQARGDQARREMEQIQTAGVDLSDPNGSAVFGAKLTEQSGVYRAALRDAQAIEFGTYPSARIDDTGDYLKGSYLEENSGAAPAVVNGLVHFRNDRAVLAESIEIEEKALDDLRSDIARLEAIRNGQRESQERATQRLAAARIDLQEVHAELNRLESEASAIEDKALDLLERSAQASKQATGFNDRWVNEARQQTQNLSPEAKERSSYNARLDDKWMGGAMAAQEADARLAKAWIQYGRFEGHEQTATVLAKLTKASFVPPEADPEATQAKVVAAHQAGVSEINQAVRSLEKAHADVGRHWTVIAQQAGTIYLLVLFGHESYLTDAIETYRSAVKGREEKTFAAEINSRLNQLERR